MVRLGTFDGTKPTYRRERKNIELVYKTVWRLLVASLFAIELEEHSK